MKILFSLEPELGIKGRHGNREKEAEGVERWRGEGVKENGELAG